MPEIEIRCSISFCEYCVDVKCTCDKLKIRVRMEEFRGRGEPNYNVILLTCASCKIRKETY